MNPGELSIVRRLTALTLTTVLAVGGFLAYRSLPRLEDPEFTIKEAQIVTRYPGATAAEVAEEVTDVIEKAVQQMSQIDRVTSTSRPGLSVVQAIMQDQYDRSKLPQVWDELRRKVGDAQGSLPPGAGPSVVNDDFGDVYGVYFVVYGDGFSYRELKDHVDMLEKELLLVPDVAKVALFGVRDEVIYVEISRPRLAQLGIAEWEIYEALRGRNDVAPSGQVEVGREFIRIVPAPGLGSVESIGNTLIQGLGSDRPVFLRDVARIGRDYVEPPTQIIRFDGRPGIGIGISTVQGGNVVSMGDAVRKRLQELEGETPIGIERGIVYWQSRYVTASIDSFTVSLLQALGIVIAVLLFAMGMRSGVLIGVILLLTVLGTFIPMRIEGVALERISLGALIIALGMLVDNAIVVTEGMQIRIEGGMDPRKAAREVVGSTMWPLLGGTGVAILAFGALGFSQDGTGEFCRSLFQVLTFSLLLSWLLAVTITPLLCMLFLNPKTSGQGDDPYAGRMFQAYRGLLRFCIRHRWATMAALAVMLALAVKGFGYVQQSFFPDSTTPQFTVDIWTTQGTDIRDTEADLAIIEQDVLSIEGVESVATIVGSGTLRFMLTYAPEEPNSAFGQLIVEVEDYRTIPDLIQRIEEGIQAKFPDTLPIGRPFVLGPGGGSKIEARFRGPDPLVVRQLAEQAKSIMRADAGARDVRDDWREQVKVIEPVVAELPAARAGLTRNDIARTLQRTFGGQTVDVYREGDKLIPILARAPEAERGRVDSIYDMQIWSPAAGRSLPLRQVVSRFDTVWEDGIIARRNRLPTITAMCNQVAGNASVVFERLRPAIEAIPLPPGYSMEWGGEYENSVEAQEGLAVTFPLMILIMVLIVVVQFNSLRLPAIIFLTVPLALIGVTAGLLFTGTPFGFMALLGALSLIGMLAKNSIVLVDEIRIQMAAGLPRMTAIVESSVGRMRPVAMAALTTVLGMIPLLPDAFFKSMAVTVMAGLAFATILTLVVVPTLYAIFFRVKEDEVAAVGADP